MLIIFVVKIKASSIVALTTNYTHEYISPCTYCKTLIMRQIYNNANLSRIFIQKLNDLTDGFFSE